uniref:Small ribosomal subunit protein uS10c n=1 Tax=Pterocladiophila hemisphaerica TaxID=2712948 RepID=A0A6M3WXP2_9FLOR|nr:ribosomal protein S10 [Pterocladiophila hemisphaerica]
MTKKVQRIRIQLQSYYSNEINLSSKKIVQCLTQLNNIVKGPVNLPTRTKHYCLLRSPHVNKDSREHFEIKVFKQIIDITKVSSLTIKALKKINISASINIKIRIKSFVVN